jgi:hypothetical protein
MLADEAARRRALAVCCDCGGIHRVGRDGSLQAAGPAPRLLRPDGVEVIREPTGCLQVRARRRQGSWMVNHRTRIAAWTVGLAAGYGVAWQLGPVGLLAGVPAFAIAFIAAAKLQLRLAPLRMAEGRIQPSAEESHRLACAEVIRIHAAAKRVRQSSTDSDTACSIYALTRSGRRVLLMGPVESEDVALYVGELLECERRLASCEAIEERGEIEPDTAAHRRSQPASPAFRYRLELDADALSIRPRSDEARLGSLEISRGRLILRRDGVSPEVLACRDLGEFRVVARPCGEDAFDFDDDSRELRGSPAFPGEGPRRRIVFGDAGAISFGVAVGVADDRARLLLDGIQDPREAEQLCETLRNAVAKLVPPN